MFGVIKEKIESFYICNLSALTVQISGYPYSKDRFQNWDVYFLYLKSGPSSNNMLQNTGKI